MSLCTCVYCLRVRGSERSVHFYLPLGRFSPWAGRALWMFVLYGILQSVIDLQSLVRPPSKYSPVMCSPLDPRHTSNYIISSAYTGYTNTIAFHCHHGHTCTAASCTCNCYSYSVDLLHVYTYIHDIYVARS